MNFFKESDYNRVDETIKLLPIEITQMYMDNTSLYFECSTNGLNFVFDIIINSYARLSFDAGMYGGDEELTLCDFRNDLENGTFGDDYNTGNIEMDIENFFEDHYENIYQYMVYKQNIIKGNEYQDEYNITVDNLLYLLKADDNVFQNIIKWPSNCYAVSDSIYKFIDIEGLELVYGKWNGFISASSSFEKGISNHGWLEFKINNRTIIIDPTRWVFEGVEPYIYINDSSSEYDRAAQKFQAFIRGNKSSVFPEPKDNDKIIDISFGEEIDDFNFNTLLEGKYNHYTPRNLIYIANTPIVDLQPYEKEILAILKKEGYDAFIPIDTKELVFGYNK